MTIHRALLMLVAWLLLAMSGCGATDAMRANDDNQTIIDEMKLRLDRLEQSNAVLIVEMEKMREELRGQDEVLAVLEQYFRRKLGR